MDFEHPRILWLLLATPPLAFWAWRSARIRDRAWETLGQWGRPPSDRSAFLLTAAVLCLLAVARPRIGAAPESPIAPGQDVVLAVDVSQSMAAEDASPNRLGLAVATATTLVEALADGAADRAAVVAFSGRGALRCPLTQNMGAVLDALGRLRPGEIRPNGSDLGAALDAAVDAFDPQAPEEGRTVVLFTDGEDHEGRWSRALERATARGVIVHAVALGELAGQVVPSTIPGRPLTYQGEPVVSRRDDAPLQAITEGSGGALIRLGLATTDLGLLYRERIAPTALARRRAVGPSGRPERFPVFLAAAAGALLFACRPWRGVRRSRRRRETTVKLACLGLLLTQIGAEQSPGTAAEEVARGRAAYEVGRFDAALAAFEAAAARAPGRPVPLYDAAATLYQLGRFDESVARYLQARERADASLRTRIDYAVGNAWIGLGDLPAAVQAFDACLASTARGEELDAVRRDAAINRRFALEQMNQAAGREKEPSPDDPANDRKPETPDAAPRGGEAKPEEGPGEEPDAPGSVPPASDGEPVEDDRPSPRQSGGAGGEGPAPANASPEDRLDAALRRIRDARQRRLPEPPPPDSPRNDGKDW